MNRLLFTLCVLLICVNTRADCPAGKVDEVVRVAHVYDGDTLRLDDGRRIRVLGINSPEAAGKHTKAEPLGVKATQAAQTFFRRNKQAQLTFDEQQRDRYGRYLAHVYNAQGQSLAASLLADGLAFHIVVPPNVTEAECLQRQGESARLAGRGVWRDSYWRARKVADMGLADTGFLRLQGRVVKITEGRDIWIELDGPLVLKITAADKRYFSRYQWRSWQGKTLEVNGWVINRSSAETRKKGFKPLQLPLRSAYSVQILAN